MYIELFGNQTIPSIRPSSISTQKFTMPSMSRYIKLQAVSKTHFHFKTKLLFSRDAIKVAKDFEKYSTKRMQQQPRLHHILN